MLVSLVAAASICSPISNSAWVTAIDGTRHRPLAEAKGHPVALIFIAHDCPICNAYAPEIGRIAKSYVKRGVMVDLVYSEPRLSLQEARAHAKSYSFDSEKLFVDLKGRLAKACRATITPEAAVYDAAGHLAYRGRIDDQYIAFGKQRAHVTTHDLRAALDAVLGHRKVSHARTDAVGCFISSTPL